MCSTVIPDIEQEFKYTVPRKCISRECETTTLFELIMKRSKFCNWQKVRVQENVNEIPPGSMPRSIDVILRHDLADLVKPGDKVEFNGCLIVVPDVTSLMKPGEVAQSFKGGLERGQLTKEGITGLKQLGCRDLSYKLNFLAKSVQVMNSRFRNVEMQSDRNSQIDP